MESDSHGWEIVETWKQPKCKSVPLRGLKAKQKVRKLSISAKVNGFVKLQLYKGNITIVFRQTKSNAYSVKKVSFEENKTFNKSNVERFINYHKKKLNK